MLPIFAFTVHGAGLPVVAGGARNFVVAFESFLDELGVEVRTGATVDSIRVESGRATAVETSGVTISARRAVLASVMPEQLYGGLLADVPGLEKEREESRRYRFGRGAMQLHFALSEPPAWTHPVLARTPVIHLSSGSASTAVACAEAEAGLLPRRPTIVVGQQYVLDPSRVPTGAAQLWIQMQEAPYEVFGDAAGEIDTTDGWTQSVTDAYVQRVLDLIEEEAPGLRQSVVASHAMTPVDLERENPNAVRGDGYGGSLELDQNLLWRPGPRTARHRTKVAGLWHIGSATHPGPGLGGASGHLAATAVAGPALRSRVRANAHQMLSARL
jgi:phytoene dehydrogenase-like protein